MKCISESTHQIRKIIKLLPYRKSVDWQITCKINKFSMNSIRAKCIFVSELKDENGPLGITFDSFESNSVPYTIVPSALLLPIPLSSEEFISQWNLYPFSFLAFLFPPFPFSFSFPFPFSFSFPFPSRILSFSVDLHPFSADSLPSSFWER